jgi:hypothetical protein
MLRCNTFFAFILWNWICVNDLWHAVYMQVSIEIRFHHFINLNCFMLQDVKFLWPFNFFFCSIASGFFFVGIVAQVTLNINIFHG